MINGCGQAAWGDLQLTTTWGDGFRTEFPDRAWARGVSSAAPFFDALLDPDNPKPYAGSVILSPHMCAHALAVPHCDSVVYALKHGGLQCLVC
jgi:hypothetical protein